MTKPQAAVVTRRRADLFFVVLGLIPLFLAYQLDSTHLVVELLRDFGVVIASLALVDFLWQLVAGGDPLSTEIHELRDALSTELAELRNLNVVMKQAHESGVADLASRRGALTEESRSLSNRIRDCNQAIDISGYTLYFLLENPRFVEALLERARRNIKIRLLLCSEDNQVLAGYVQEKLLDTMRQQMKSAWTELIKVRQSLEDDHKSNFSVRRMKAKVLHCSILRVDDQILVTPYLHSKTTDETPVFLAKGADKPLFLTYKSEFETCFDLAEE